MREIIEEALARKGLKKDIGEHNFQIFKKNVEYWKVEPELYMDTGLWVYDHDKKPWQDFQFEDILSPFVLANYSFYLIDVTINGSPEDVARHIRTSTNKIFGFMTENRIENFQKYLELNIEMYPFWVEHNKNGKLNSFLLAFADQNDIILAKLKKDIAEMIDGYVNYRDRLRMRILRTPEIENEIKNSAKILNMEVIC